MTRQPTILFIPFGMAISIGVGMFALGTFFHSWKPALVAPLIWTCAYILTKRDHNAIRVWGVLLRLLRLWATAHRYGGWSVSPPRGLKLKGPADAV